MNQPDVENRYRNLLIAMAVSIENLKAERAQVKAGIVGTVGVERSQLKSKNFYLSRMEWRLERLLARNHPAMKHFFQTRNVAAISKLPWLKDEEVGDLTAENAESFSTTD